MRLTDPTLLCPHYCQSSEIFLCSGELNLVLLMLTIGLLVLQGSSRQPQQDFKMVLYVQRRYRQVMHSVIELSDFLAYEEDIELYSSSQASFPKVSLHKHPFILLLSNNSSPPSLCCS
jgi:hypothetical protein